MASNVGKGKIVDLSDVAHDIRYVKLETNDSSLIGSFPKAYYENGRIYVVCSKVIIAFDENGKFLFKLDSRGRGPKESVNISNILFLPDSGGILIHSRGNERTNKLLFFDENGIYLRTKDMPVKFNMSNEMVLRLNSNLYVYPFHLLKQDSATIIASVYDSTFNVLKNISTPYLPENEKITHMQMAKRESDGSVTMINAGSYFSIQPPNMYIFKDNVRFLTKGNDTIFSLDSKLNYYPAFWINYGKYKNQSPDNINISTEKGKYITQKNNYFIESEENIILQFYLRDYCHEPYEITFTNLNRIRVNRYTDCYALYNKKTGAFTLMNQPVKNMLGFREDIKNGPPFLPVSISSDFQACALFTASQIIEYAQANDVKGELKEIVKGLKDTDNPIVAIARMK
ncbi:hypothetical protein MASR2M69_01800 [Bacteroidota bacterium]